MQSVGVKEFRVGVTQGWEFTLVFRKLTYFDYYVLSFYLKDYVERIFAFRIFVDLGYLFSHCFIKYYLQGSMMVVYFYDGLYRDYLNLKRSLRQQRKRKKRRGRGKRVSFFKVKARKKRIRWPRYDLKEILKKKRKFKLVRSKKVINFLIFFKLHGKVRLKKKKKAIIKALNVRQSVRTVLDELYKTVVFPTKSLLANIEDLYYYIDLRRMYMTETDTYLIRTKVDEDLRKKIYKQLSVRKKKRLKKRSIISGCKLILLKKRILVEQEQLRLGLVKIKQRKILVRINQKERKVMSIKKLNKASFEGRWLKVGSYSYKYKGKYKDNYKDNYKNKYNDKYSYNYKDKYKDNYKDKYKNKYDAKYSYKYNDKYRDKYNDDYRNKDNRRFVDKGSFKNLSYKKNF